MVLTLAGLLPLALAGCDGPLPAGQGAGTQGACAAPEVFVEPATAAPGEEITLTGVGFQEGCADNPGVQDSTPQPVEDTNALTDLTVRWVQAETTIDLANLDADEGGGWTTTVSVPPDARTGEAWIRVAPATDVAVTVSG